MNRQGIATALGVSLPTVDAWQREGMPVRKHGSRGRNYDFDAHDCLAWRDTRELWRGVRAERLRDLAQAYVLDIEPSNTTTGAEFVSVFGGWSLNDVRELATWGMPWSRDGEDAADWTISMALAFRWIGTTLAMLGNNSAKIEHDKLPSVLRGLRIRAGLADASSTRRRSKAKPK